MPDYNLSYVYVFAFFVVGVGLVSMMMMMSHLIAPRKPTREKLRTYESDFYIFALIFVVFDVEVWACSTRGRRACSCGTDPGLL